MFKKITTLFLAVVIFTTASSVSVFAKNNSGDETTKTVKTENLRQSFLNKENKSNQNEKENLNSYNKQKKQGQRFSTSTKILIGVGIAAAIVVTVLVVNDGFKEAANPF